MNDYIEARIDIEPCNSDITDLAACFLAEAGFESFVPDGSGLTAYAKKEECPTGSEIESLLARMPFEVKCAVALKEIEGQDWNSEWEKNYFKPIVVGNECVVHSSFHTDVPVCSYDIVIDPKMAFGTGHHATTTLIMRRLLDMNVEGKKVVDVGTGTGILAILAAMRGAAEVTGIEIDPAAYVNAVENVQLNGCGSIKLIEGDASALEALPKAHADLLTANINRNVITADLPQYVESVKAGGELIFSGFYEEDIPVVRTAAEACGLEMIDYTELNKWVSVRFVKP